MPTCHMPGSCKLKKHSHKAFVEMRKNETNIISLKVEKYFNPILILAKKLQTKLYLFLGKLTNLIAINNIKL